MPTAVAAPDHTVGMSGDRWRANIGMETGTDLTAYAMFGSCPISLRQRSSEGDGISEPSNATSVPQPAGVVGPHRDFDPVSGADLGQQAGDVGLGGRQADEELGGDLGVRAA